MFWFVVMVFGIIYCIAYVVLFFLFVVGCSDLIYVIVFYKVLLPCLWY